MSSARNDVGILTPIDGRIGGLVDKLLALRADVDAALMAVTTTDVGRLGVVPKNSKLVEDAPPSACDESLQIALCELGVIGCMLGLRDRHSA